MKITKLFLGVALAAALSVTLVAQRPQTGYHTVACFKVKPDQGAELRKFLTDESHKLAQGRIDDGELTTWYLVRSVLPGGASADCDYLSISMFPGAPHLLGPEQLSAAIKKAGMSITPEDYINHRNAVSTLVSVAIFQNVASVGSPKKGDYFAVNYMKTSNIDDWIADEKKTWQPIAESLSKDGLTSGWSVNVQVMPRGSDLPYQGVTVDAFPSFDAIFTLGPSFVDHVKKAHPDQDPSALFASTDKLRTILSTKVFQLEDVVTAAK